MTKYNEKLKNEADELREKLSQTTSLYTQEKQAASRFAKTLEYLEKEKISSDEEVQKLEQIVLQLKVHSY